MKVVSSSSNYFFQSESNISYDATLQYGSGAVVVFSSRDSMDRFTTAMINDNQGTIDEMIASGEVGYVDKGTKCNIVKQHITWGEVKILEDAYSGRTVCVALEAIQKNNIKIYNKDFEKALNCKSRELLFRSSQLKER